MFFSEEYNISLKDLNLVKNVVISFKKTSAEIDIAVINTITDTIIGFVEAKSGIYDIPYGIDQLDKISKIIKANPKILKKNIHPFVRFVVATIIPPHNPVTGASYSDVQLISSVLFSKTDTRLKNIIQAIESDPTFELRNNIVDNVYEILLNLRKDMVTHIDPLTAIKTLGKNLIVI